METTSKSKVYTDVEFPRPSALVLGNELTGVCTEVLVSKKPYSLILNTAAPAQSPKP
jgi:tRNA G18 (ribose-2'-O)-methylase SpoU